MLRLTPTQRAYLAGFLDGDGSVYVRAKPNSSYRFGFQIAPYIVLFQSAKDKEKFKRVYELIQVGALRERKDGILEYVIQRAEAIQTFARLVRPYVLMKREQLMLLEQIIEQKVKVENESDYKRLLDLVDKFRDLNYSKKRKRRTMTP